MSTESNVVSKRNSKIGIRTMTKIGMLSAAAVVLMLLELPVPFAPPFYELDFSEVPVLVGCFAMGPLAGAAIELIKILTNFILDGTITAGVGELANFLIGCAMCIPAAFIYKKMHTRKGAIMGMEAGTLSMTILGCILNAYVLLPAYAKAFHMPIGGLIEMGTKINPSIKSLSTFVLFAVAPFNLLKGILVSLVVFLIYKKISPILKIQ